MLYIYIKNGCFAYGDICARVIAKKKNKGRNKTNEAYR